MEKTTVTFDDRTVAIEQLSNKQVALKVSSGFALVDQKVSLVASKVVFDAPKLGLAAGDLVYVKGDAANAGWNKTVYKVDETEFVLVQTSEIVLATK